MNVIKFDFTNATLNRFDSADEWRSRRTSYIGGSDAGVIIGANKWKNNVELWEEKVGIKKPADLSKNPLVTYGKEAEKHLRELFKLDFPEYSVSYEENNMWLNERYPFAHASLDGWIADNDGHHGILEIKTATINSKAHGEEWKNGIPQSYYAQILHYLMVTEFDFAIVKAQLKYDFDGEMLYVATKHYRIDRAEIEDEISYLEAEERKFAQYIKDGIVPSLNLPEI